MRITRVYTKSGDFGQTRLGDGSMRPKHDARIEAYGTIDELNACLGQAIEATERKEGSQELAQGLTQELTQGLTKELGCLLGRIQNHLFDLGSDLCRPESDDKTNRFPERHSLWLEKEIDRYNETLTPLENFILPVGNRLACALHVARTVARRAERRVLALAETEQGLSQGIRLYLNRLSDLLFVLSRVANSNGKHDVLWQPDQD